MKPSLYSASWSRKTDIEIRIGSEDERTMNSSDPKQETSKGLHVTWTNTNLQTELPHRLSARHHVD